MFAFQRNLDYNLRSLLKDSDIAGAADSSILKTKHDTINFYIFTKWLCTSVEIYFIHHVSNLAMYPPYNAKSTCAYDRNESRRSRGSMGWGVRGDLLHVICYGVERVKKYQYLFIYLFCFTLKKETMDLRLFWNSSTGTCWKPQDRSGREASFAPKNTVTASGAWSFSCAGNTLSITFKAQLVLYPL